MIGTLSLKAWADIAQLVVAIAAIFALFGALAQLLVSRAQARRVRVYEYSDRINGEILGRIAAFQDYWDEHSYAQYRQLNRQHRLEGLFVANFIEEIAALYNRGLLDRDVAAEVLGIYVERAWTSAAKLVHGIRTNDSLGNPTAYCEWEAMQKDTPNRQLKAAHKRECKNARRKFFHGA